MKFVTVTFFYDFARYFNKIEDVLLEKDNDASFYNISIYPCAHNYWKKKKKHSVLPWRLRKVDGHYSYDSHRELIEDLIFFNAHSFQLYGKNRHKQLVLQCIDYLNKLDKIFYENDFDCLISSGESRLIPKVAIYLAKKYNVKIIYFEQGPFGTTMFDPKGVNANISFKPAFSELTDIEREKVFTFIDNYKKETKHKIWSKRNQGFMHKFSRLLTLINMYQPKIIENLLPVDLSLGQNFLIGYIKPKLFRPGKKIIKGNTNGKVMPVLKIEKPYIALYLQVPVDAQLIEHSPHYRCFYKMLCDVLEAKPQGVNLLVREHPQYIGKYDKRIYELIENHPSIFMENNVSLNKLIENSKCSIVNNSAVGIESLLLGRNVVCLGQSYYSNKGITFDYDGGNLEEVINKAIKSDFNRGRVESFMYEFIFKYLSLGHFQDTNFLYPDKIDLLISGKTS